MDKGKFVTAQDDRFALLMIFQNVRPWLDLHLPYLVKSNAFDGVVAVDGGSTDDGADAIRSICKKAGFPPESVHIVDRQFDYRFDIQTNVGIQEAEKQGYKACLRLDTDELMLHEHLVQIREILLDGPYAVVRLPRYNFTKSRRYYCPQFYPDHQGRGFRLGMGLYYFGTHGVHETLWNTVNLLGLRDRQDNPHESDVITLNHANIYHYAGLASLQERHYRNYVYDCILKGEKPEPELPKAWKSQHLDYPFHIEFTGPQPLSNVHEMAPLNTK